VNSTFTVTFTVTFILTKLDNLTQAVTCVTCRWDVSGPNVN